MNDAYENEQFAAAILHKHGLAPRLPQHVINRKTDLPMVGKVTREGNHRYVLVLKFKDSMRWYDDEVIHAPDIKHARDIARRNHPNARIK